MSIELLERAAKALGPLLDEVVFVGGATIVLWITDPAAPPPRPTLDVDLVVNVTTRLGYERFSERMRATRSQRGRESRSRATDVLLPRLDTLTVAA